MSDGATIVIRHLSGARATQVDVIPAWPHRELVLGRAPSAAVRFDPKLDRQAGRYHAQLQPGSQPGHLELTDLCSRNGTFVNGVRVKRSAVVRSGDIIQLGEDGPAFELIVTGDVRGAAATRAEQE